MVNYLCFLFYCELKRNISTFCSFKIHVLGISSWSCLRVYSYVNIQGFRHLTLCALMRIAHHLECRYLCLYLKAIILWDLVLTLQITSPLPSAFWSLWELTLCVSCGSLKTFCCLLSSFSKYSMKFWAFITFRSTEPQLPWRQKNAEWTNCGLHHELRPLSDLYSGDVHENAL